ncbi:MAG: histidinol-phosphate transaminase [Gammaproteobacteria bacterium]|nr:histidinol-phosphate transaminase [Gammaproteobacteria bacterium]
MELAQFVRPEIRTMRPYRSAQFEAGLVRLNANENPWRPPGDTTAAGLNWYPEPRPARLTAALARHYGIAVDELLVTRGSSEAIDVLIRACCPSGTSEIVICPPTFGMYETYAQIQGAAIRRIPLQRENGYALDVDAILAGWQPASRLLFVCTPNNPTGNAYPEAEIRRLAAGLAGRGLVVLDAAYAEFAEGGCTPDIIRDFPNVVVLRTLSKAMSLAGVRCGSLIARAELTALLGRVLPPYTFSTLCAEAVERGLEPANARAWQQRVQVLRAERSRLAAGLVRAAGVKRVWPSEANFLMVEAADARALVATARKGGVGLRDFSWDTYLPGCVRITIGTPDQNDQLLTALGVRT